MAAIAIPNDVLDMLAACEAAYAEARRKGYAKSPDVAAAVVALKAASAALTAADSNLDVTKGLFKIIATLRVYRTWRVVRKACVKLQTAIDQVDAEYRLYCRALMLIDSDSNGPTATQNAT